MGNANFEFAIARLENSPSVNQSLLDYLKKAVPTTKRLVDLRNGLEHPNGDDRTIIEDFRPTPGGIDPPAWHRGNLVVKSSLLDDIRFFLDFLICFCENVFFHGLLDNIAINFPFEVVQVPDSKVDPECPVLYRLELKIVQQS